MLLLLFLLFTVVPIVELALLLQIGSRLGPWITFGLVIVTGAVGAALAKWQGVRAATRVQSELARGELPAAAMIDGLLIFAAGVLLITPGVLTDGLGFALLIPPARASIRSAAAHWFKKHVEVHSAAAWSGSPGVDHAATGRDEIIDVRVVETREVNDDPS